MLAEAFNKCSLIDLKLFEATELWDPPNKNSKNGSNNSSDGDNNDSGTGSHDNRINGLFGTLFSRIVTLEQIDREKSLQIERLSAQLHRLNNTIIGEPLPRYRDGILLWRINDFNNKIHEMSKNPNKMYYSDDVYTHPYGYRFCARMNISPKAKESIGLHVHLMQSDNDYHLDWPFRGCIKIWMIHRDQSQTRHDKIMSNEKILAFQRPKQNTSPRGFGFIEYANIDEIRHCGFIINDTLTIKLDISIV